MKHTTVLAMDDRRYCCTSRQGWSRAVDRCLRHAALAFTAPIIDWFIPTMGRDGGQRRCGLVTL